MWCVFLVFLFWSHADCIDPRNLTRDPCSDRYHLFLTPGVLTAGGSSRACVSRFYPGGPATMTLTLRTEDEKAVTVSRELSAGDGGCVDISVPKEPNTKADLSIRMRYPEAQCTWDRQITVRIASGKVVAIHTERARYRPGETLRVRVFALKANLSPAPGQIDEVWLEGPRGAWDGTRAAQWHNVPTRLGIAQVHHDIDDMAPTGTWTVRARLSDGSQGSAAFLVSNYELPPFQMTVRHASKVLRTSDRLVWTVCVRYPWTEAVEGMLVIRIRGAGSGAEDGIRTAVRLRAPRACHRHAAAAKRIGLNDSTPPDVVVADFSFQEEGTGTWQNTTVVSQVVDKEVTLEFLTGHRTVISPGLPYKLKVKAMLWDDRPASDERLRVCRTPMATNSAISSLPWAQTCHEVVTDDKGIARVMFEPAKYFTLFYKFEATIANDSTISAPPVQLSSYSTGSVYAALGPLRADKQSERTFVPLYITAKEAIKPITVHFVVITRGGIIYRWGATTQCAIANAGDHYQIAPREGNCSSSSYSSTLNRIDLNHTIDSLLDHQMLRVMLPIKVTHQMCPDSHLVAYFYYGDELVSASKHIEMEDCFANKVEISWQSRQVAPGGKARLQIKTDSRALCALTAMDIAAKMPQAPTMASSLLAALKRLLEINRNLTEYDAAGQCFFMSDSLGLPSSSLDFTARWLAAAGVRMVGGETSPTHCEPAPAAMFDDVTMPRSDFSETWLWRLVDVGVNGTAVANAQAPDSISKFEANAICLTKSGLAVATPATLQVFREFFIHADSPRRLRRGDSTIVKYRLFNYLYEPLSVQIQILTDPHLKGPVSYVETACVPARSSAARHVTTRARLPGAARLSVRAVAVNDANCGNDTRSRTGISDEVIIRMTVTPEGVPVHDHQSALLCARGNVATRSFHVSWSWPRVDAVPGTETLTLWAVGDMAGPLLADADSLVQLPRGCGEQNMARLATNLLALTQLSALTPAAATARAHVARGFTRQLQYVHPLGGFSAFGPTDERPSTWLTAFSLKYLRKAHKILSPGLPAPPALDKADQWLLKQQMENGCFRNEGQVFHRELKGGLNEDGEIASVALTAYVIAALVESSPNLSPRVVHNSLSCLRALPATKTKSPTKVYAQALLGYAFMRLRRYEDALRESNEASLLEKSKAAGLEDDEEVGQLAGLLKIAKRSGDYVWWETSSLSSSVEATGYALLALASCPSHLLEAQCAPEARGAVRWLAARANPAGGFIATQDTLVALEALTTWLSKQPLPVANLTVTATSGHMTRSVKLVPGEKVPELVKMEAADILHVDVKGSGCALVQATRSYHTIQSDNNDSKQLSVQVTVHTDGSFACNSNNTACFCAAVIETCVAWLGAFPAMALLEAALPGGYSVDAALLYSLLHQTNTLLRRIEMSPTTGRVTLYLGTRDGSDSLGHGGHRCYSIHAMGPKVKTRPAYVRIMDYYAPTINDTQMYTIPEECLPRITNDTNEYNSSDNLFAKAKSIDGSEEILIMNDYSYEDIPGGIPLDDPMYADNLTQDQDEYKKRTQKILITTSHHRTESPTESSILFDYNSNVHVEETDKLQAENSYKTNIIMNDIPKTNLDEDKNHNHEIPLKLVEVNVFGKDLNAGNKHRIEERDDEKEREIIEAETTQQKIHSPTDNPQLSSFHVVDSEKDLDVPTGVEGPIPAVVLPPENFVSLTLPPGVTQDDENPRSPSTENHRGFNYYPARDAHPYYFNQYYSYPNYRRYYLPVF